MRQHDAALRDLDVLVRVVTFEPPERARMYAGDTELPWPILCDEDRALYRAYGMDRGPWWRIFGISSLLAYARLLVGRGRRDDSRARHAGGDVYQLGGDVLIDYTGPSAIVRLHHVGRGPADRPAVSAIVRVVREHAGRAR